MPMPAARCLALLPRRRQFRSAIRAPSGESILILLASGIVGSVQSSGSILTINQPSRSDQCVPIEYSCWQRRAARFDVCAAWHSATVGPEAHFPERLAGD
jgi:hypothetical protein